MTTVTVDVDIDVDEILPELGDEELEAELRRRRKRSGKATADDGQTHVWTPVALAEDLRTAFYARNASRFEQLLCVLDEGTPKAPLASPFRKARANA
jgi:hypothetical protein